MDEQLAAMALLVIEDLVSGDDIEHWGMLRLNEELTDREKVMHDRLSAIYHHAHSVNDHSCAGSHAPWRRDLVATYAALMAGPYNPFAPKHPESATAGKE